MPFWLEVSPRQAGSPRGFPRGFFRGLPPWLRHSGAHSWLRPAVCLPWLSARRSQTVGLLPGESGHWASAAPLQAERRHRNVRQPRLPREGRPQQSVCSHSGCLQGRQPRSLPASSCPPSSPPARQPRGRSAPARSPSGPSARCPRIAHGLGSPAATQLGYSGSPSVLRVVRLPNPSGSLSAPVLAAARLPSNPRTGSCKSRPLRPCKTRPLRPDVALTSFPLPVSCTPGGREIGATHRPPFPPVGKGGRLSV